MSREFHQASPMFRIDVPPEARPSSQREEPDVLSVLTRIAESQERQTQLLAEISEQLATAHRQRANELGLWKQANPQLARSCRAAAETLSRVQTRFLRNLTDEVADQQDALEDGEFMLNEFIKRFGPRLPHHLDGVLQVLSQLSSAPSARSSRP